MRGYRQIVFREFRKILTDRRLFSLMLIGPFFYGLIFGGVYYNGRVEDVHTMVVDQDHSALSRQFVLALNATEGLSITAYGDSTDDFRESVKRGSTYLCVLIPRDFARDLKRGKQSQILLLADGSNNLITNVCFRAVKNVVGTFGAQARAKRLMAYGIPRHDLTKEITPIQTTIRPLYNPFFNYSVFLLTALVCIALQQVCMMSAAISLSLDACPQARDELGTITRNPMAVLLGKATSHAMVLIPLSWAGLYVPFGLFHASFHGHWPLLLGVTGLFALINSLSGFGVAGVCKTPVFSCQVLLSLSVPIFTLTGATWPVFAMPRTLQDVAYALPLTHFVNIVRKVSLEGVSISCLRGDLVVLYVWLLVAFCWAWWSVCRLTCSPEP